MRTDMKKLISMLLGLTLALTLSLPVLAADTITDGSISVTVDGQTVAEVPVMVPVRAVAEALGFTVTWDGALPGARLDNGSVHTEVVLGRDLYTVTSSTAIGMTAPFSLGAAPAMLAPGTIYVPVGLFRVLLGNRADAVTVQDGAVVITTTGEETAQIPNPIREYDSLTALRAALDFAFPVPQAADCGQSAWRDIAGDLAEIDYTTPEGTVTYRASRGGDGGPTDNSGDYTVYPESGTLTAGDTSVSWRGRDGKVCVAAWITGDTVCSLRAPQGISSELAAALVSGTKA